MAAPCEDVTKVVANKSGSNTNSNSNGISPCDHNKDGEHESRQLLYPETFGEFYKEGKLQIVGNKKCPPSQLITQKLPQSSVLSQIKAFLPELSKANASMAEDMKSRPDEADIINIECVAGDDSDGTRADDAQHIEMNLSLVPSELLVDSDDESSDNSSADEVLNEEEQENSSATATSSNLPQAMGCDDDGWLKFPQSSMKVKKDRKTLIEEVPVVNEDVCDEDFTNR